jgi:uncharacterized protein
MRLLIKFVLTTLVLYLLSMSVFYFYQEKFIFQNEKLKLSYNFSFQNSFEEINLKTDDGNNLNAVLFKTEKPKGVILYFHGNKGNLERWGDIASYFTKFGHDVFVVDYRSYGKSTGNFNEYQMYKDAQICYDYLKEKYAEDKITIYGRSLGSTFAVNTAALNNPKQLILEAPFYNLKDVVTYHYPFLPYDILLRYKFNSDEIISGVQCKTTIFHGTSDKVVPFSSGEKLFKRSNPDQTSFFTIEGGTHHNLFDFSIYQNEISVLLEN